MTDIDAYIHQAPEDRREALTRLRDLCRQTLDDYDEAINYGMPTYTAPDAAEAEIGFASQKGHISLYLMKATVLDQFRERFPTSRVGKGCIRYPKVDQIDFELIEEILECSTATDAQNC